MATTAIVSEKEPTSRSLSQINLRPYQHDAIKAVFSAIARQVLRVLLVLPTGTGKTVIFAELIRQRGGRALVLAHRDELLEQARDKILRVFPKAQIGLVKGPSDETDKDIVLASVQTLARRSRLARLYPNFDTVVVDEAHHAAAESYRRILEHVGAFEPDGPLTVGVTATPDRADGAKLLGDIWQENVYTKTIIDMIEAGYLADIRAIRVQLAADFDRVHVRGGDLVAGELSDVMRAANACGHAVAAYQRYVPGRKALVFTPTVALAHEMAEAFCAAGVYAEALDGGTPIEERRAMLARFRDGDTRVVANCAVLTEGFDEPSADCIVIARPTTSRVLYTQMIGRGTRLHPGKADCLILDLVGSTARHNLVTAPAVFGMESRELEGVSVVEACAIRREAAAKQEAHGKLVAQTVDLFNRRSLHWVVVSANHYTMSIGTGTLNLTSRDLAAWIVTLVTRDGRRVLAEGLDLGFAQGTAEDFARKSGAGALVTRDAPWRREPATDKQRLALQRWRIPFLPTITKGEACDLIAAAVGRVA